MNQKSSAAGNVRYPRLEIAVVEKFIREHDGKFTKSSLWERLADKITHQTFDHVIDFLLYSRKISVERQGNIIWIFDSEQADKRKVGDLAREKASQHRDRQTEKRWSKREEANAITGFAFRNGFIEDLHAGKHSELLENPQLSRITDAEMKKLMIEASQKMAELLRLKEEEPAKYWKLITWFNETYCKNWEK